MKKRKEAKPKKVPKVTQVTYSRLQKTDDFENERLEIVVAVQSGDGKAEATFAKRQVLALMGIRPEVAKFEVTRGHGPVCICDECM